jgi:hypothetical protein
VTWSFSEGWGWVELSSNAHGSEQPGKGSHPDEKKCAASRAPSWVTNAPHGAGASFGSHIKRLLWVLGEETAAPAPTCRAQAEQGH